LRVACCIVPANLQYTSGAILCVKCSPLLNCRFQCLQSVRRIWQAHLRPLSRQWKGLDVIYKENDRKRTVKIVPWLRKQLMITAKSRKPISKSEWQSSCESGPSWRQSPEAERQVYEKEENYLAEFEHIGTVITGFQPISEFRSSTGPDSKGSRARKRRHSVTDAIRLFSWTSCTSGVEIDEAQLAAFKKKDSEGNSDNSDIEDDGAQDKNFT
ncbi:hypothetical protein D918_08466, partial [Trichuris suis]